MLTPVSFKIYIYGSKRLLWPSPVTSLKDDLARQALIQEQGSET